MLVRVIFCGIVGSTLVFTFAHLLQRCVLVVKIGFVKFEGFSGVLFAINTDWFL